MKKITKFIGFIFVFITLITAGCLDIFSSDGNKITYESHPTSILYTISYGYLVNCTGIGNYEINYNCDEPEVLSGSILSIIAHDNNYTSKIMATFNKMKAWNIREGISNEWDLGITSTISCNSFLVSDLEGKNALTISEIKQDYPDKVLQYTQAQSNETTVFINPNNLEIVNIASNIYNELNSENAFLVAKELFRWLKQTTNYQIHIGSNIVQSAGTTLNCKTGDCDDLSFLYISLCRSIGIPARFIRGFLVEENIAIPHAWVEVFVGGGIGINGWIPVECAGTSSKVDTEIHQNFGIESSEHLRLFEDDGSNESLIISLSAITYSTYGTRKIEAEFNAEVTSYTIAKTNQLVIDENGIRQYT